LKILQDLAFRVDVFYPRRLRDPHKRELYRKRAHELAVKYQLEMEAYADELR
jgi:hypothetical protein